LSREGIPYHQDGRYETLEQAIEMDDRIRDVLDEAKMPFLTLKNEPEAVLKIIKEEIDR
jgi:sulfopyruvate decarboxylase TPP-binding subunit